MRNFWMSDKDFKDEDLEAATTQLQFNFWWIKSHNSRAFKRFLEFNYSREQKQIQTGLFVGQIIWLRDFTYQKSVNRLSQRKFKVRVKLYWRSGINGPKGSIQVKKFYFIVSYHGLWAINYAGTEMKYWRGTKLTHFWDNYRLTSDRFLLSAGHFRR